MAFLYLEGPLSPLWVTLIILRLLLGMRTQINRDKSKGSMNFMPPHTHHAVELPSSCPTSSLQLRSAGEAQQSLALC